MTSPPDITAVVFDLDGVVRHWHHEDTAGIEERHGLPAGALLDTAFGSELGEAVVTGALTYEEWTQRVAHRLGSPAAVEEWSHHRGTVDPAMVEMVGEVRATGRTVALLSNATTRLEEDLAVLGLDTTFDHVFNTARLGVCKPYPAAYQKVVDLLSRPAEQIVFTDDQPHWAEAATAVGMHGIPFVGPTQLRAALGDLGLWG